MTNSTHHLDTSERLRQVLDQEFEGRGRFSQLEAMSGISSSKWRNFLYKKQSATAEMIDFVCTEFSEREAWIKTGENVAAGARSPFGAKPPRKRDDDTVGTRLNWVIREWAAPKGEQLFGYLSQKTNGVVSAAEWAEVVLGQREPSVEMVATACHYRPMFTEWVLLGTVHRSGQVDPTDDRSVREWQAAQTPSPSLSQKPDDEKIR